MFRNKNMRYVAVKKILVTIPCDEEYKQSLRESAPDYEFEFSDRATATAEQISSACIILGNVPAGRINCAPELRWLQLSSSGADAYVKEGILSPNTLLTSATGAYGKAVAEHLFAVTLSLMKKLHLYRDKQHEHCWADMGCVSSLSDATVLVVGTGDIGLAYARLCKLMGARVIGVRRRPGGLPEYMDELHLISELDGLLPEADIVASFLPGSRETDGLFSLDRLMKMKPGAFFVNGGRGNVVSLDDLWRALHEGIIAGAGVDVFETEPLPAGHPLWDEPRLIVTPHVAGDDHMEETFDNVRRIILENLRAYLSGGQLKSVIDRISGYCG